MPTKPGHLGQRDKPCFAILRDDEDDLSDQDGASGRYKHEQGYFLKHDGRMGNVGLSPVGENDTIAMSGV